MSFPPMPPPPGYHYGFYAHEYVKPFVAEENHTSAKWRRPWHNTGLWEVWIRDANGSLVATGESMWRWLARARAWGEMRSTPIHSKRWGLVEND